MARLYVYPGQIAAGAIATADIGNLQVTGGKIAADAIDGTKVADDAIDSEHVADGAIDGAHLSSDAKVAVLDSKFVIQLVVSGDRSSPAANNETVTTDAAWGFNSAAGIVASASAEGYPVLLENVSGAAGAHHFNTTAGTPNAESDDPLYKANVYGADGEEIVDGDGNRVWGVFTAVARDTTGPYKLRFFSGPFGNSAVPYTLSQIYFLAYPKVVKLSNLDRGAFRGDSVKLSKTAAGVLGGSIGTDELENDSVTIDKIADGAVGSDQLGTAAVIEDKIGTGAVTQDKIGADAVDGSKIEDDAIGNEHIADNAVDSAQIASNAVTSGKIASNAVGAGHIAASTITNSHISGSAAIAESKLADLGKEGAADLLTNIQRRDVEVAGPVHANGVVCNQDTDTAGLVTAQGSPDMTVAVAAATVYNAAGKRIVGGANATLSIGAADGSNPRYDLITFNASGVATVTAGTAAGSPTVPALPSGHVKLAVVKVGTGVTTLANAVIYDHRRPAAPVWRQQVFVADGSTLNFALSRRARGSILFLRGMAPQTIVGSPDDEDEIAITDAIEQDGTLVNYGTGMEPLNGQILTAMFWG